MTRLVAFSEPGSVVFLLCAMIGIGASGPICTFAAMQQEEDSPPSVRALRAAMESLSEDSLYSRRVAGLNAEERRAETRKLGFRGLSRLGDRAIAELAAFRHEALEALPPERCGSLSAGYVSLLGVAEELTAVDSARAFRGYRIISDAVRAELRGSPDRRPAPDEERVRRAVRSLASRIPGRDSSRFASLLTPSETRTVSASERCWFHRTLLRETLELEPQHRATLLRLMALDNPQAKRHLPALIHR